MRVEAEFPRLVVTQIYDGREIYTARRGQSE